MGFQKDMVGKTIKDYYFEGELGSGSFGVVYLVKKGYEYFAIKMIDSSKYTHMRRKTLNELKISEQISSQGNLNLLKYYKKFKTEF